MSFTVVGVPIDSVGLGRAELRGTERSPAAVRAAGLGRLGWSDLGDLDVRIPDHDRDAATGLVGVDGVVASTTEVRRAISEVVGRGERPFVLGGCCALLPGVLAGARDVVGELALVYVDGHLDFYDGVTSPTGEAADMPIAIVLGEGPQPWVETVLPIPVLAPAAIAILGYHDQEELDDIGDQLPARRAAGIFDASADRIRAEGPVRTGAAALAHVQRVARPVWFHVDLDVLDETVFPATDYLISGGLDWEALIGLVTPVTQSADLIGWSLSCYNPDKDPSGTDGRAIVQAMERLFGNHT